VVVVVLGPVPAGMLMTAEHGGGCRGHRSR
jgi:hypothetical protein